MADIAPLFFGWQETMIWSCLQGCMGRALWEGGDRPRSAMLWVGDFCFFAGSPSVELAGQGTAPILVPRDGGWERALELAWGDRVRRWTRYATEKDPNCFDRAALKRFAELPQGYELRPMDRELYAQAMEEGWSRDLCAVFQGQEDYCRRGLGVAALYQGRLAAGASSYTVYRGGIEIEIDTAPRHRRRGLAAACGARLILDCLDRGLYPSWDAHDLRSAALARKLGYQIAGPYPVYLRKE